MAKQIFDQKNEKDFMSGIGVQSTGFAPVVSGDPMYDKLYAANPYNSLTYNRSGWQALMSALGFRTDYDRWLEDAQVNANEYNAQVASIQQQNDYNSPEAEASRMREAGLNPDLLGTQGVSDSASPVQDVNGMQPNVGDEFVSQAMPAVGAFVSHVMDTVSKGFMFAKDLLTINQAFQRQDVDVLDKLNTFAGEILRNRVSSADMVDDLSFEGRRNFLSIPRGQRSTIAKEYGIPRRYRSAFSRILDDQANSLAFENDLWKKVVERNKAKSEYAKQSVSQSESGELKTMQSFWKPIVSHMDEIKKLQAEFDERMQRLREGQLDVQGMKQDFEYMYWDTMNEADAGKAKAGQDTQQYWVNYYKASVQKTLNRVSKQITDNLQTEADKGSTFAQGCLLAWSLGDMLNFGLSDIFDFAGTLFNPLGKALSTGLSGKGLNKALQSTPVPKK